MVNNIPETLAFKSRLPNDDNVLSNTLPNQVTVFNSISVREDFQHTPRRTISEVLTSSQTNKCWTMCTIMSVDTEFGWYYMACKVCSKKVLPIDMDEIKLLNPGKVFENQLWKCSKCFADVENVIPRFMLTLRVMDSTGEAKFLLFDKVAMEVVNQTAAGLTQYVNEIQDPDEIPLALTNICGKTYLFKVAIENSNIVFKSDRYKVVTTVTQTDMVKEYSELCASENPLIDSGNEFISPNKKIPFLSLESGESESTTLYSKRKSPGINEIINDKDQNCPAKKACINRENEVEITELETDKSDEICTTKARINFDLIKVKIEKTDEKKKIS